MRMIDQQNKLVKLQLSTVCRQFESKQSAHE